MRNALILLLILVNCSGATDAPRATLISTPVPTPYPVVTNGDEFEKLNVGDHYWHNGELLEKHWYDTTSVVEAPTPESAPKSPLSFVAFIVVVVILFLLIWTLRHAGSNDRKEDPPSTTPS